MYEKVREFIERHIDPIGRVLVIVVIALWILSQFIPALGKWILEEDLLNVLVVVLLVDAITYLVEIKRGITPKWGKVSASQADANHKLVQYVKEKRPKKADLIEYSSYTVQAILECLKEVNCEVRLLLQNPEAAETVFQKRRIEQQIENLLRVTFKSYDKVEIRCYSVPGSIRGRNFDNTLISVGWYTYRADPVEIYGHVNPVINAYTNSVEGHHLQRLFNQAFQSLWEHPSTVPVSEVLKPSCS